MKIHGGGGGHLLPPFLFMYRKAGIQIRYQILYASVAIHKRRFLSKGGQGVVIKDVRIYLEKRRRNKLSEVIWSHVSHEATKLAIL